MTFDSNSPEFSWANVQIAMLGRVLGRVRGIKFSMKKDKEYLTARGGNPHAIQHGNKTPEGELILLQSVVEALQGGLEPDEDLTDLAPFDITVTFVRKNNPTKIVTYILKGVEFTDDNRETKQGDKFMEITLPIMFLRREAA